MALALAAGGASAGSCQGKLWVGAPVLSLGPASAAVQPSGDIGGTGHAPSDIGGTGHAPSDIGGTGHQGEDVGRGSPARTTAPSPGLVAEAGSREDIGGTGHHPGDIGGTGRSPEDIGGTGRAPGDIGGTGHAPRDIGGTGFVGVISGFGSICVNGAEIEFDAATPVVVDGQPAATGSLALGQAVSVTATPTAAGMHARSIAVTHAVVGPVQSVDGAAGKLVVLGQTVVVPGDAVALATVHVGDMLSVDGNRQPGAAILATRVARAPSDAALSVMGAASEVTAEGFRVQDLRIRLPQDSPQSAPSAGQQVMATGTLGADGVLTAAAVVAVPQLNFSVPVKQLDLQGYVRSVGDMKVDVDGAGVAIDAHTALPGGGQLPEAGARVHVLARTAVGGAFVAERISIERPARPEGAEMKSPPNRGDTERGVDGRGDRERGGEVERGHQAGRPGVESGRSELQHPNIDRPRIDRPQVERPQFERPEVVRPEEM
jgi:hypothetical protein